MNLVDGLKAALPGWTVTPDAGIVDADKDGVNIEVQERESSVIARAFTDGHAIGTGVGADVQAAVDALRVDVTEMAKRCEKVSNALGGTK